MRRFVVIGQKARATPDFLLVDIPSTSGRLDVLVRSLRAALLFSHGVRRDSAIYLVLLGVPERPRTIRVDGAASKYLRPDERSLATTLKKALATEPSTPTNAPFHVARHGIAIAEGGYELLAREPRSGPLYLLEQHAPDIRATELPAEATFVLGDHLGLPAELRDSLLRDGAIPISVGPRALQTEDVITLIHNELDRRHPETPA
ncbi:MAG: tRNA (pseudouridine(54)-N(1))-methyltransferase TrmY [Polyangiales bacterium]